MSGSKKLVELFCLRLGLCNRKCLLDLLQGLSCLRNVFKERQGCGKFLVMGLALEQLIENNLSNTKRYREQ